MQGWTLMACAWVFSMGSKARSDTTTETNNLALDQSTTVGEGTAILDSIVIDGDNLTTQKIVSEHRAAFEVLTKQSSVQLESLLYLGEDILKMAKDGQISMADQQYHLLDTGVQMLADQRAQGKYVLDFVDVAAGRTFDLADKITTQNQDTTTRALEIVADVKSGDFSDTLKAVTTLMALFALGAIYLSTRDD